MINVTKTYLPNKEKFNKYVDQLFESGLLTNNGVLVQTLEKRLKEYLGVKHLLLVSNGTLALQIAYKVLDLKGDVITTPFSFAATVSCQVWEGLNPIFCDIDRETFCMDCDKLEGMITESASAIIPVHVFGNPCYVEKINQIASKNNLKVVYDAAHAFGVRYKGESVLNYGDIATLSFHSTKVFHTIEGGALIFNNSDLYEKAKLMINFGIDKPDSIVELGINAKMNEFQAAMGLCVLDDMEWITFQRKRVYNYYRDNINNESVSFQKFNPFGTNNYAYFPVVFENEDQLLNVKAKLNDLDIYPRRYFYPSLDTLCYLENPICSEVSRDISSRILCLPMYDSLSESELKNIVDIINS